MTCVRFSFSMLRVSLSCFNHTLITFFHLLSVRFTWEMIRSSIGKNAESILVLIKLTDICEIKAINCYRKWMNGEMLN